MSEISNKSRKTLKGIIYWLNFCYIKCKYQVLESNLCLDCIWEMSNVQLKFSFCDIFFGWNKLTNFWAPIRTWPLIMKMLLLKCMPNRDLKHKSKWISFSNLVQPHYSYLKQYPCLNETKLYWLLPVSYGVVFYLVQKISLQEYVPNFIYDTLRSCFWKVSFLLSMRYRRQHEYWKTIR